MTCRRKKPLFPNSCGYAEISTEHTMIIVLIMNLKQKYEPCSNNKLIIAIFLNDGNFNPDMQR